jgi:hypothetical protein
MGSHMSVSANVTKVPVAFHWYLPLAVPHHACPGVSSPDVNVTVRSPLPANASRGCVGSASPIANTGDDAASVHPTTGSVCVPDDPG